MGEDGIIVAANVIGNTIRRLDKAMFGGAEKWISEWEVMFGSVIHVIVSGSPKLNLYETAFGWGRPKKIEDISTDKMRAISLIESRDEKGGIEVGLALPTGEMDAFKTLYSRTRGSSIMVRPSFLFPDAFLSLACLFLLFQDHSSFSLI